MSDKIYFSMDKYIALQRKDRAKENPTDKSVTQQPDGCKMIFKEFKPRK